MVIRICSYNVEFFNRLFKGDNTPNTTGSDLKRLEAVRDVLKQLKADLIGVLEAPNTLKDGSQTTVSKLENFAQWAGLATTKAMTGFISAGIQEIALLYDPSKLTAVHAPGGGKKTNPKFDDSFEFDTDDDRIKEVYKFFRPPLEAKVTVTQTNREFYLIAAHPKSKGIFNAMDLAHWELESRRNRRKLYAECTWIRRRVDEWLDAKRDVVVLGDFNDGPGMDFYEFQFGKSAVEIVMGDLFAPDRVLRNHAGRPKWTSYGFKPASARFKDRFTEDYVNVLIDHILASSNLKPATGGTYKIWNPYEDADAKPIRALLNEASDHYPVTLDLDV